jgi:hypothetical protein
MLQLMIESDGGSTMAQDQDILSIVQAVTCDLCSTLRIPVDDETSQRIAKSYRVWLNNTLRQEYERTLERDD